MICIAESGSTKTIWVLLDSNYIEVLRSTSVGLNPYYATESDISRVVETTLPVNFHSQIDQVHFYGAGCSNSERCAIVERSIQKVLIGSKVNVEHDLLASARATCQRESGIACILGTGSNSCAFDGKNIIDNIPSMGFILGDEGSGASLGRSLLSAWFYRELPADLEKRFIERFQVTQKEIIDKVYSEPNSNRYVASFAVFCAENRDHSFVQNLIKKNFELFVSRMVLKYETAPALPIHFVGSVAEGFQSELNEVLENHDLTMGRIIKSPIDELIKFHCDGI